MRNIFLVWFCTGFWHGASWNFILWGLHFFAWLMLEKYLLREFLQKLPMWLRHGYTLLVVFAGWGGVCHGGSDCLRPILQNLLWRRDALERGGRLLPDGLWPDALAILAVGSTHWVKNGWNRLPERARDVLGPVLMLAGLVVCTAYLVDGSYNPFLYFRF